MGPCEYPIVPQCSLSIVSDGEVKANFEKHLEQFEAISSIQIVETAQVVFHQTSFPGVMGSNSAIFSSFVLINLVKSLAHLVAVKTF